MNRKTPSHINWFSKGETICCVSGRKILVFVFNWPNDELELNDFAIYVRNQYISDEKLDLLAPSDGKAQYLRDYVIPQDDDSMGVQTKAGDFAEIIFSDLFEFKYDFVVPRWKQSDRIGKNSPPGTDIIAYRFANENGVASKDDVFLSAEVKSNASQANGGALHKAVEDSAKRDCEKFRWAVTLEAYRRHATDKGKIEEAKLLSRFSMASEMPYRRVFAACVVDGRDDLEEYRGFDCSDICSACENPFLFVVHKGGIMGLIKDIFERCLKQL